MTPKVRVTAVLIEDGRILLVRQKVDESRGWSLPLFQRLAEEGFPMAGTYQELVSRIGL